MSDSKRVDWSAVYTEHRGAIWAYLYRRLRDPVLCDDIAAEVFAKAIAAERRGDGAHSNLAGWLYRIARNLLADHFRQQARQGGAAVGLDDVDWLEDRGGAADDQVATVEAVERVLRRLTEPQRVAFVNYLAGYTMDETGAQLGISRLAVKAVLHRARVALRVPFRKEVDCEES